MKPALTETEKLAKRNAYYWNNRERLLKAANERYSIKQWVLFILKHA